MMITVEIPDRLAAQASEILQQRGTDFEDFFRIELRSLVRHSRTYSLGDKITFGKYEGEYMDVVIRTDPEYISWCLRQINAFTLTPEALELLATTGVDL